MFGEASTPSVSSVGDRTSLIYDTESRVDSYTVRSRFRPETVEWDPYF